MKLVNIHSERRRIYLFCRNEKGELEITEENSFYPYYYELDETGSYKSFDGKSLRKISCTDPYDIKRQKTNESYESDIYHTKRYLIDEVKEIDKCKIKYCLVDIETKSPKRPDPNLAEDPISCITLYNSFEDKIKTWFLLDYPSESHMVMEFVDYLKDEQFDLFLAYNVTFDYLYLYNRYEILFNDNFACYVSAIGKQKKNREMITPAGMSVCDYLLWYKKIFTNLPNYDLDSVLKHEFGFSKVHSIENFDEVTEELKLHNIEDVERLVEIEKKHNLLDYYDEIRRYAKVNWEDLNWNSRIVDMLLLAKAKECNVVLPMKNRIIKEQYKLEGAYREVFETGAFFDIGAYDLSSAYPSAIINYCLDASNIMETETEDSIPISVTERESQEILETYFVKQDPNKLLPLVASELLTEKAKSKKLLKSLNPTDKKYKDAEHKYNAIKSITNSAYGVIGNRQFRLYDNRVASMVTSIVRDLLHYVKEKIEMQGYEVLYIDTDSVYLKGGDEKLSIKLNELIQDWSMKRFNKKSIIEFDYEGTFKDILILALTHYIGHLILPNGKEKEEIKGIQAKKSNSTEFIRDFQPALINKILNKESKESICSWVTSEIKRIRTLDLLAVARPCKLARRPEEYTKKDEIFVRALRCANHFTEYNKKIGERYYWIPMIPIMGDDGYYSLDIKEKKMDVIAFDKKQNSHVNLDMVNWDEIIRTNIIKISTDIFKVMEWDIEEIIPEKTTIIPKQKRRPRKKKIKEIKEETENAL